MGSNADTARTIYDAFAKGDVGTVLGVMDPKIDWQEPESLPFDNQASPQGVAEGIFGPLMTMFPDFTVNTDEIHEAGDVVFSVGTYRGTSANTDKKFESKFAHVWRFGSDGKVTGFRTYNDTHAWLESIGKA